MAFSKCLLDDNNIISRINLARLREVCYRVLTGGGETRKYKNPVDIRKLRLRIFDEYGRTLDLNNMDWSISLTFSKL